MNILNEPNHKVASYCSIMKLRLSALSNAKVATISNRAKEILADIKATKKSAFECIEMYWEETNNLKAEYAAMQ